MKRLECSILQWDLTKLVDDEEIEENEDIAKDEERSVLKNATVLEPSYKKRAHQEQRRQQECNYELIRIDRLEDKHTAVYDNTKN